MTEVKIEKRKHLTKPVVRRIRKLFKSGERRQKIAEDLGIPYHRVLTATKNISKQKPTKRKIHIEGAVYKKPSSAKKEINWKEKYFKALAILIENDLVDL